MCSANSNLFYFWSTPSLSGFFCLGYHFSKIFLTLPPSEIFFGFWVPPSGSGFNFGGGGFAPNLIGPGCRVSSDCAVVEREPGSRGVPCPGDLLPKYTRLKTLRPFAPLHHPAKRPHSDTRQLCCEQVSGPHQPNFPGTEPQNPDPALCWCNAGVDFHRPNCTIQSYVPEAIIRR